MARDSSLRDIFTRLPATIRQGTFPLHETGKQDEDCLYLNVWTAGKVGDKRPVMVWIHGGGFAIGEGSHPTYNGVHFAREGVVLVTINYRLGPLGFFAHPKLSAESLRQTSGNYGTLDQIAALRWVKRNIAVFGGDPDSVTIFGESAGSVSCHTLLTSPLTKGLFHRAILQSGVGMVITQLRTGENSAEAQGIAIAETLGVSTLKELRALSPQALIKSTRPRVGFLSAGTAFGPIIDGYVLLDNPLDSMVAGTQHRVPIMLGSNADEATLLTANLPIKHALGYQWLVRKRFPNDADEVLRIFPVKANENPKSMIDRLITTAAFVQPARLVARLHSRIGVPTFLYHFTRVAPAAKRSGKGATHGIEIVYVFGESKYLLKTDIDQRLSRAMRAYWIQFATTGNPNGGKRPKWSAYTRENDAHLEFGDTIKAGRQLFKPECDLLERITVKKLKLKLPPPDVK